MTSEIGPLVAADETLHHQVTDTFGAVVSSDLNWTEKIWANASAHDGTLQVSFGLGKYQNRGVLDAFGGISRGTEQWTVRGSRALWTDPDTPGVGPLSYEIVEPLRSVRIRCERNDVVPIAFDVELHAVVPPGHEGRERLRASDSGRITNDVVRYHQAGAATGWLELDGVVHEITPTTWSSARDHSWGVRNTVGTPPKDLAPTPYPRAPRSFTSWQPVRMVRADGSEYVLFHYLSEGNMPGQPEHKLSGAVEHPDGRIEPFAAAHWQDAEIDDVNRRFVGGTLVVTLADGTVRPISMRTLPHGTGFHLGTGLYFGFDGARHGQWRGELHVDGEHVAACDTVEVARRVHQLRDCVVQVDDPVGGGRGVGIVQTIAIGEWPNFGTTLANTFI